ncbi:MAG: hypothetical protein AB7S54_11315 [Bacteroidales bacterium]
MVRTLKRYGLFFILLAICAVTLIYRANSSSNADKQFTVTNVDDIDSITIKNSSNLMTLSRAGSRWNLNSGQEADSKAIGALLNVLANLNSDSPVPEILNDSLISVLGQKGTKVAVYGSKKKRFCFYVYFEPAFNRTIGTGEWLKTAYFLDLTGYSGDITALFVTDKLYWTGNKLFDIDFGKLSLVEVEIPGNPQLSYKITINGNGVSLKNSQSDVAVANPDTFRVHRLIQAFGGLSVKKLSGQSLSRARDQVKAASAMRVIRLCSGDTVSQVALYPVKVDSLNELGVKMDVDPDRFYVVYANNQVAEATYVNFSPVFKDIADLVAKN